MNNLNSILIEGEVCETPVYHKENETVCGAFSVDSKRLFVPEDGKKEKSVVTTVSVVARTELLVKALEKYARKGRGVRIVGRLARGNGDLYIEAEHIEFRPEFAKVVPKRVGKKAK